LKYKVLLQGAYGRKALPPNKEAIFDSSDAGGYMDKKVSKAQITKVKAVFDEQNVDQKPYVVIQRTGGIPSTVVINGMAELTDTNKNYALHDGDKFSLINDKYKYQVIIKQKKAEDDRNGWKNYLFYKNQIKSIPDGDFIDNIHAKWADNHQLLEYHHGYIQWLFPLFLDSGMNSEAKKLKKIEAAEMREDLDVALRFINSYRVMLNFYGMRLVDTQTGEIARASDPKFCAQRYKNLNANFHNNLRISRIIISLGHLGFTRYKKPFLDFLTSEVVENGVLQNCRRSLLEHWTPLVNGVGSKQYLEKTLEVEEDRVDSIFFRQPVPVQVPVPFAAPVFTNDDVILTNSDEEDTQEDTPMD